MNPFDTTPKNFKLVTPHATVLIWNFVDRINADGAGLNSFEVEEVMTLTSDVISISTNKTKSTPAGSFEIRLSPRLNWVSRITPGSWCAILMSPSAIDSTSTADRASFKMLGRVESVRGVIAIDQETGARNSAFVMTGVDWGSAFDTTIYIDQAIVQDIEKSQTIHQAYSILNFDMYSGFNEKKPLPTPSMLVNSVLNLWGVGPGKGLMNGKALLASELKDTKVLLATDPQFQLPKEVAEFMRQKDHLFGIPKPGSTATSIAAILDRQSGRLTKYDDPDSLFGTQYEEVVDSFGIPDPSYFMGPHSVWQLLTTLSNPTLYEVITDIRWSGSEPKFALYHRIRPFVTRSNYTLLLNTLPEILNNPLRAISVVKSLENLFKNVRRVYISKEDIRDINFGTNWRDKANFIEMRPDPSLIEQNSGIAAKLAGQTIDQKGYERDGFKPRFETSSFLPYGYSVVDVEAFGSWKYLLREWYFNSHLMLNGALTIIGQAEYIQVGDNIQIDREILGPGLFNVGEVLPGGGDTYLTAHVESVAHNFAVNSETGARTFTTTIQFVRGILTDKAGETISNFFETGIIDKNSTFAAAPAGLPGVARMNPNALDFTKK